MHQSLSPPFSCSFSPTCKPTIDTYGTARDEHKKSEEENAELRENIRKEREQLEVTQQEQQKALDVLLEQRHGAESMHTKREEEMQRRIRGLESDLQVACRYAE